MAGKWRMLFSLWGLGWDEPSAGSERGGGNVAALHGGRSAPASLRVSGPLVKSCSVSRENRDPSEILDWASFFYMKSQYGREEAKIN